MELSNSEDFLLHNQRFLHVSGMLVISSKEFYKSTYSMRKNCLAGLNFCTFRNDKYLNEEKLKTVQSLKLLMEIIYIIINFNTVKEFNFY